MTTLADVISECRNDYLLTGAREQRNKLAAGYDADDTTFTFTYDLKSIDAGAKLAIGLEDLYVWDATPGSNTAVVSRGEFGSTAAAHTSGDTVLVNPRFTDAQILRAVNHELQALSAKGLFRMRTVDLTFNASVDGYDLTSVTDVLSIYDMRYKATGSEKEWPRIDRAFYDHQRNLDTAIFASGQAVFIRDYAQPGNPVRVWYKAPFGALAATTDDVASISGLHAEAHDLLALGAAIALTAGSEIRRNQTEAQGDTRRAQEVPPGAKGGSNQWLIRRYQQRIADEKSRLNMMYPQRV